MIGALRRPLVFPLHLPEQLRQLGDVRRDASRLVDREHLRLPRFGPVVAGVEVCQRLPVGVAHDLTARHLVSVPGRREAAGVGRA
jgi:hypothetical protein